MGLRAKSQIPRHSECLAEQPAQRSAEHSITWIDDYIDAVRDILYVREEDSLLIIAPNQSYKLNPTGLAILEKLLAGASINQILPGIEKDAEKSRQVSEFFMDIKSLVSGCYRETDKRSGITVRPFTLPHNKLPVLSEIALTYACNLDCVFCYAGCSCTKAPAGKEMTTGQVRCVLNKIKSEAKVPSVSFTGGEPTMREDLPELIKYASKKLSLRVNLITNGTLIDDRLALRLEKAGLSSAQVSIEGPNALIHDSLTRVPGSFKKAMNGVRALRKTGMHVHTHLTITTLNEPHLERHVGFIKELGLERFSMNQLIPTGTGASDRSIWISYSDIGPVVERVRKAARTHGLEFMWYSPTPLCMYNPIAAGLGNKSCAACDGLLSVSPSGGVLPCSSFDADVGNMLEEDFIKIWNNKESLFYREKKYAWPGCNGCEHFTACAGACPLYWDEVGYKELERANYGK